MTPRPLIACIALAAPGAVLAQSATTRVGGGLEYVGPFSWTRPIERVGRVDSRAVRRVDQGFEDIDPLGTSLRHLDSRAVVSQPVDFSDLYEAPDGTLYRFDGGIGASFEQSDYVLIPVNRYESVVMPAIPAGTVFHIGLAPEDLSETADERWRASATARGSTRIPQDDAAARRVMAVAPAARALEPTVADDDYRRSRLTQLLESVRPEQ